MPSLSITVVTVLLLLVACTNDKNIKGNGPRDAGSTENTKGEDEGKISDPKADENEKEKEVAVEPDPAKVPEQKPGLETGVFPAAWIHGSANCGQDANPPIQIHSYNKNTIILRQNKCLNFEGPFTYLLFGEQKALLVDSGATASAATFPLRQTVETLMSEHYGAAVRPQIQLVVAHSHAHGDHRAADGQFTGQSGTLVVGTTQPAVANFFSISDWPNQIVDYELGNRKLQIIPIPGHEASHIAVFDAKSGLLLSGDTVYPGRLYIQDWTQYRASVARLRTFIEGKTVSFVLGAHVEMSRTAGVDYPAGSTFQADEHVLELGADKLILLDNELKAIGAQPMRKVLADFIISP